MSFNYIFTKYLSANGSVERLPLSFTMHQDCPLVRSNRVVIWIAPPIVFLSLNGSLSCDRDVYLAILDRMNPGRLPDKTLQSQSARNKILYLR
jgi:hypothetical protein